MPYLNIEWVYEAEEAQKDKGDTMTEDDIVSATPPLPPEVLKELYDLAILGNLSRVKLKVSNLNKLDKEYIPFANKVLDMASKFEDTQLIAFLEKFAS